MTPKNVIPYNEQKKVYKCEELKILCAFQVNQRKMVEIIKFSLNYAVFWALRTSKKGFLLGNKY